MAKCRLQTSSEDRGDCRQGLPSPYKGMRLRLTEREHHQICSSRKGERQDKLIMSNVRQCQAHYSYTKLLVQEISRELGVITRTGCRTGLFLFPKVFKQRLSDYLTPFSGRHIKNSKNLSKKQPRCPSADEWKRQLWYIYTMEYYPAIKKNSFESVLMRWMKLEPIIQSEVSQKDKEHYSIRMHIYGI